MSQFSWESEWKLQELREESFIVKHVMNKTPKWMQFIQNKVPAALQNTLESACGKAFVMVFDKGAGLIEKTYNKEKHIQEFRQNQRQMDREEFNRKNLKRFERHSKRTIYKNMALTTVEGVGLGLVGMGLPDIPIFVSVLLKSIYEIAISYGFGYTSDKEKLYILKVIDAALQSGEMLRKKDEEVNKLIERYLKEEAEESQEKMDSFVVELMITRQIDTSATALSHELLYWKFIQGKAIVGVIGGSADVTCMKRITDYAMLKYKRRFLLRQREE